MFAITPIVTPAGGALEGHDEEPPLMAQIDRVPNLALFIVLGVAFAAQVANADTKSHAHASHSIIDVHTHLIGRPPSFPGSLKSALTLMDRHGVEKMVVSSPPRSDKKGMYDYTSLVRFLRGKRRFHFLGGGSSLNPMLHRHAKIADIPQGLSREFADTAQAIVDAGAAGFGEMASLHISVRPKHAYKFQPADHPMLLKLADVAARSGLPIDLHMDGVDEFMETPDRFRFAENPGMLPGTLKAFDRLLRHNRKAKIVWAHGGSDPLGEMTPGLIGELMDKYEHLYMSLRIRGDSSKSHNQVFDADELDAGWLELLKRHSDRFVIGTDSFFIPPNIPSDAPAKRFARNNESTLKETGRFLSMLPPDLARKVARENAIRIYRLGAGDRRMAARGPGAPGQMAQPPGKRALAEAEVRRIVVGNTLNFTAPSNGRNLFVHFAKDGRVVMRAAGKPKKIVKQWFFTENGLLCRTFGRQNKKHCTRVSATNTQGKLMLWNKKVRYQATLLKGQRFSN